jgi:hypothetical protein
MQGVFSRSLKVLAAFFAAFHDGFMEAVAEAGWHFVDLVGTIDLNRLARRA